MTTEAAGQDETRPAPPGLKLPWFKVAGSGANWRRVLGNTSALLRRPSASDTKDEAPGTTTGLRVEPEGPTVFDDAFLRRLERLQVVARRQQGASAPLARPPRVPYGTLYAPTLRSSGLTASDRLTQGVSHTHTLPDQTHTLHVENIAGPGACFPVWMGEHAADDRLCSFHDRVRHPSLPVERGGGGSVASLHRRDARAATITRVLIVS